MTHTEAAIDSKVSVEYGAGEMLSLSDVDRDADVYVTRPRNTPLGVSERHALLKVATENGTVEIELNGETLDAVADALQHIQEFHQSD